MKTAPRSGYEEGRAAESLFTDSGPGLGVWVGGEAESPSQSPTLHLHLGLLRCLRDSY